MIQLQKSVLVALFSLASASAWPLDLLQCYQEALVQDASFRAAGALAESGREALPQARAQLLPIVSASLSSTSNRLSSNTPNAQGTLTSNDLNYPSHGESLTVRQPIYRKYLIDNYKQAQSVVEDTEATLANERQNLAVRVASVYFEALLAEEQHHLVKTQLANYSMQLEAAKKSFKAGSGTRTDIDDVQARLDMAVAEELVTRQNVDFTRRQLQVLVNKPIDRLEPLNIGRLNLNPPEPNSLEYWTEQAERRSPEMKALQARSTTASYEVEKARSGHMPTLDAIAQWSRSASENTLSTQTTTDLQSIGVQLNIPIYSGGGVDSTVRQTLAAKERARQMLEATRRDLGVRVQKEFRGMTEGVLRIKALEQAVRSTEQSIRSNEKSFQAGSRTRIDILNAENNRMVSLRDLAQSRFAYLLSKLRLLALANEAGIDAIEDINKLLIH